MTTQANRASYIIITLLLIVCATLGVLYIQTRRTLAKILGEIEGITDEITAIRSSVTDLRDQDMEDVRRQIRGLQVELSSHVYAGLQQDSEGLTPDMVMSRYLKAKQTRDWERAYLCLTAIPEEIDLVDYVQLMEDAREELISFSVGPFYLRSEDLATVFVTSQFRFSDTEHTYEKEPWSVFRVDGIWRVKWMPRQ